jgi:general secretion pathway protein A
VLHRASSGIPRRINTLCDRLLLLGFMQGKVHLELADVNEVLKDMGNESALPPPSRPVSLGGSEGPESHLDLDVDLSHPQGLQGEALQAFSKQVESQMQDVHADRLARLERSMLRLERINLQNLKMLQRLLRTMQPAADKAQEPDDAAR